MTAAAGGVVRRLASAAETRRLGERLAALARPGDLIVLTGPLGAGKTVLTQGIAAGLGVTGAVTSPTFVIARVHRGGRVPLVHADAYRLGSVAEVEDLDLDSVVDVPLDAALTVVEWGAGLAEGLADGHLRVDLERPALAAGGATGATAGGAVDATAGGADVRIAHLVPAGAGWAERLRSLA